MANTIADKTGGELFEIVPVTPYPEEYTPCTEVALEERDSNARPAIKNLPASIEEYDTILIGYPIWWHTAPMIIGTFLENYDLTGIEVYPFTLWTRSSLKTPWNLSAAVLGTETSMTDCLRTLMTKRRSRHILKAMVWSIKKEWFGELSHDEMY